MLQPTSSFKNKLEIFKKNNGSSDPFDQLLTFMLAIQSVCILFVKFCDQFLLVVLMNTLCSAASHTL
ncbi:hypothetical protein HanRHA438_Chr07g0312541 [Helianthus annuus]|uniref:Uncharacterized protein n=1 Tax=Helianthus annuus TaxID=4232 RepID=A0A251UCZ7_HELAN|nr:hypothetical protein HanIR_Chr07g0326481 [Helianthus annuus]KAJ0908630.1 hypothetical protein HanRHA438_Chr07g0312541 [Helianthus annuus]